ncbi:GNAT family protein [Kineosporia sp. NBRC 101731]|uniref:GNAT family N-acetyltransferase n=1 Tax=Kineosporia sp. NBRC 101731 TaxID=3032199 RepID=UPI0024A41045|nr:GNAT family protein [Kineosporia sp. NBRC 101731]GLY28359.1 N-acetyltransferase [Kineosporia sp. NBRC 101731]
MSRAPWSHSASTVLRNEHVELHPVAETDREPLRRIAFDPQIWTYFVSRVENDHDFDAFFDALLADHASGRRVVRIVVDRGTGQVAGSSSYGNLAEADGRLEIGWSWLGADFRGKGINRWVKYLLLSHAFEVLGAERVEFKTDVLNDRARAGLSKIGATQEGVLRSFNPMPGGRRRDAIFYSVLRSEWPSVEDQLRRFGRATGSGT